MAVMINSRLYNAIKYAEEKSIGFEMAVLAKSKGKYFYSEQMKAFNEITVGRMIEIYEKGYKLGGDWYF